MKINTQILKGLKTLNENFSNNNFSKEIRKEITEILDAASNELINKDGIKVPYIGMYDNQEVKDYYEKYGISETQLFSAYREIKQAFIDKFRKFGIISASDIRCNYNLDKRGKFKFPGIDEKFNLFTVMSINIIPEVVRIDITNRGTKTEIQHIIIYDPNDTRNFFKLQPNQIDEIYSGLEQVKEFLKEYE